MKVLHYKCKELPNVVVSVQTGGTTRLDFPASITFFGASEDTQDEEYTFWWTA